MTSKTLETDELSHAKEMAKQVTAHHFGGRPKRIEHQASGLSNYVFSVKNSEGDFILRLSFDPTRLNSFIKEQWAQDQARQAGVPTAEILEVGNDIIGLPFMISKKVAGSEATHHPARREILQAMGRYTAMIHTIHTNGFGSTFDWSSNQLSRNETWIDFLDKELQWEARIATLEKRKMLTAHQAKSLKTTLEAVGKSKPVPSLNHGDMRLKNMIVSKEGDIVAVLDWEHCTSNLSPHWDLSLALHDLSIDEKQDFLLGYALSEKHFLEISPIVKAINILNYAPEVERLAEGKETLLLDRFRIRLSGALDLYSLA